MTIPAGLLAIICAVFAVAMLRLEDALQLRADASDPKGWGEAGMKGCGWALVMALQLLVAAAGVLFLISLLPRVRWTVSSIWEAGLLGLGILLCLWVIGGELAAAVHPRDVPPDVYIPLDDRLAASGKALVMLLIIFAVVLGALWLLT